MKHYILNKLKLFWMEVFPSKTLAVHPVWLSFRTHSLEIEFQQYFYQKYLPSIHFAMAVSVLVFLSFQFFDYMVTGEFINPTFPIRFIIYLPFSVLVIYFTYLKDYRDIWSYLVLGWVIITSIVGLICIYLAPNETQWINSIGLMVFLSISFYLYGLRPAQSLLNVVGQSVLALYFVIFWEILPHLYLYPLIMLIVIICSAGFFIAWRIDFSARYEFYLQRRLEGLIQEKELLYTETLLADQAFRRLNPSYSDNRRKLIANLLTSKLGIILQKDLNQLLGYYLLAEENCIGNPKVKSYFSSLKNKIIELTTTTDNIRNMALMSYNLIKPVEEPVNISALLTDIRKKFISSGTFCFNNKIDIDIEDNLKGKIIVSDSQLLRFLISNITQMLCMAAPEGEITYGLRNKAVRPSTILAIDIACLSVPPREDLVSLLDSLIRESLLINPLVNLEKEELLLIVSLELSHLLNAKIDYYIDTNGYLVLEIILSKKL